MPRITVDLTESQACALARLCEKLSHGDCAETLYGHVPRQQRIDQAYTMLEATAAVLQALTQAGVRSWPWIETGIAPDEPHHAS